MKKQVVNPYLPSWEYVPDGEPHVFGDRVYLYGSHDRFDGKAYCLNDYVCWSAPVEDLGDWKYEGVIYRKGQDPAYNGERFCMWAPDVCAGPDGKYYMYYCGMFSPWIGVARADQPAGPYEYYGRVRHADGSIYGSKIEDRPFDPGVLADDDGKVWLYTAFSNPAHLFRLMIKLSFGTNIDGTGSYVMELDEDMLTIKSHKRCLPGVKNSEGTGFEGHEFYEASSMRKFNGKYYYIYSSALSHELAYAVSDFPDRGFVYKGPLHSNGNIGCQGQTQASAYWGNNHGSVERIGEDYYIFGHRQTNGTEFSRQGVAEKLTMNPDGTFQMAEMTSCGLNGGPLAAHGVYEAGIACVLMGKGGAVKSVLGAKKRKEHPYITQDGEDRESDPAQYIANFADGCVAGYKYFALTEPETVMTVSVRGHGAAFCEGTMTVAADPQFHSVLKQESVALNGEECALTFRLNADPGIYGLYLQYRGSGALDILWISFDS